MRSRGHLGGGRKRGTWLSPHGRSVQSRTCNVTSSGGEERRGCFRMADRETEGQVHVLDFHDRRSMKVVWIPHCELNQNARVAGAAEVPAAVAGLVRGLMERGIGIVQLPCPELIVLGLDREHFQIRSGLDSRPARRVLRRLARQVVYQIEQYRQCGVRVLGVFGKNGSPACGVEMTWKDEYGPGTGAFIEELQALFAERGLDVPVTGLVDRDPDAALAIVDQWLAQA